MLSLFTNRGREKVVSPLLELSNDLLKIRGFLLCTGGRLEKKAVIKVLLQRGAPSYNTLWDLSSVLSCPS